MSLEMRGSYSIIQFFCGWPTPVVRGPDPSSLRHPIPLRHSVLSKTARLAAGTPAVPSPLPKMGNGTRDLCEPAP